MTPWKKKLRPNPLQYKILQVDQLKDRFHLIQFGGNTHFHLIQVRWKHPLIPIQGVMTPWKKLRPNPSQYKILQVDQLNDRFHLIQFGGNTH